CVRVESDFDVW
nr:immunoglobulin heavy chain junction region [Macaca mulatta]